MVATRAAGEAASRSSVASSRKFANAGSPRPGHGARKKVWLSDGSSPAAVAIAERHEPAGEVVPQVGERAHAQAAAA